MGGGPIEHERLSVAEEGARYDPRGISQAADHAQIMKEVNVLVTGFGVRDMPRYSVPLIDMAPRIFPQDRACQTQRT